MKRHQGISWLLITLLLLLGGIPVRAATEATDPRQPVQVGVHITDVSGVDFQQNLVRVDFYVWFLWQGDVRSTRPAQDFRVINAREIQTEPPKVEFREGRARQLVRCSALVKKNWTVTDYPFDSHTVRLFLEDTSGRSYTPDTGQSGMAPGLSLPGWDLGSLKLTAEAKRWPTRFGALEGDRVQEDHRLVASFRMSRHDRLFAGLGLFIEVFTGVVIALFIAWLALWVPPRELEVRAGLTVGALFAVVGSQLSLAGSLPPSSSITLADTWHMGSYLFIALMVLLSVATFRHLHRADRAREDERPEEAEKLERAVERFQRWARVAVSLSWLLVMTVVTLCFVLADPGAPPHY